MKFRSIEMENFRQFHDEEIEFSTNKENNITVIHGQNGSGKTTLLNAFRWVLYDELRSIEKEDRLVNQGVMLESDIGEQSTVSVEMTFDHEGMFHRVQREHVYERKDGNDLDGEKIENESSFTIEREENGTMQEVKNPKAYIRQIIPIDLSGLFFFDGEYINELSGIDNQDEIQDAIRRIMGLTIMERSRRHLKKVENNFRQELQDVGSDKVDNLIDKRNEIESDLEQIQRRKEDLNAKQDCLRQEIIDLDDILNELDKSDKINERIEDKVSSRNKKEERIDEINEKIEDNISEHGFIPFILPVIEKTAEEIDRLRKKGEIPSELSNEFVDNLLNKQTCICGRSLNKDGEHYHEVESHKSEFSANGLDRAAIQYVNQLNNIKDDHSEFVSSIEDRVGERKEAYKHIETLNGEIDDLRAQLRGLTGPIDPDDSNLDPDEYELNGETSISNLEEARSEKQAEIEENQKKIGKKEKEEEQKQGKLIELENQIDTARENIHEAKVAKCRKNAARYVHDELKNIHQNLQKTVRERANVRITETFNAVAHDDYEAEITDDFRLRIIDSNQQREIDVDKSKGERQIASLSFIGSLIDVARCQYEKDMNTNYFTGGIYPVAMDSPFGALDNEHRRDVSKILPTLAEQVIVFVTDSQWNGPVKRAMSDRIGQEYTLQFEESGGKDGIPITKIQRQVEVS